MVYSEEMALALYVARHRVEGRIATSGYRLLDVLNDPMSEYLEVYDAGVTTAAGELGDPLLQAAVAKSEISLAVILTEEHEAEDRRRFTAVDKKRYPALPIADGFEIRGTAHLDGAAEPAVALASELDRFFPLTGATVFSATTGERVEAPVVMPNKRFVSLFYLGEQIRADDRRAA